MSTPLDVRGVAAETFTTSWRERRVAWDMVTVPMVMSLAIHLVTQFLFEARGLGLGALLARLADVVPTTMYLVAWQRYVLLGPGAVGWVPGLSWTGRESRYLLHLLSLSLVPVLLLGMPMLGEGIDISLLQIVGWPAIAMALLALRLGFGLTATAIDIPWAPALSWRYGRRNGFAILGLMLLPILAGVVAMVVGLAVTAGLLRFFASDGDGGASFGRSAVVFLVSTIMSYAQVTVIGVTMAAIFRHVTGFQPGSNIQPPP